MKIKLKSNLQAGYNTPGSPAVFVGQVVDMNETKAMNLIVAGFAEAIDPVPASKAPEAPEAAALEPAENAAMPKPQRKKRSRKVKHG